MGKVKWTQDRIARLRDMYTRGFSAARMCRELGLSPGTPLRQAIDRYVVGAPESRVKVRACLRCREDFISEHAGNRLCGGCRLAVAQTGVAGDDLSAAPAWNGAPYHARR